jgi:hypothetical protein
MSLIYGAYSWFNLWELTMASESFLDGKTILRFSKNMDMTGGLGQHLSGLDSELLGCNSATIIIKFPFLDSRYYRPHSLER